jgi:hypothetical protein
MQTVRMWFLALLHRKTGFSFDRVGARFSEMFGRHEHLDILFLSPGQETDLRRVCAPFHVAVAAQ